MPAAPKPANDTARVAALRALDILDTAPERNFDSLVRLASFICETPISLVSLVDADRQWFKARVGLEAAETSRDVSFCAYAVYDAKPLIVPDAMADYRFLDNPLVTSGIGIRFYAGIPLTTSDGFNLGSLCVIDTKPRNLRPEQAQALNSLAQQAMALLELRRVSRQLRSTHAAHTELEKQLCSGCRRKAAEIDSRG